MKVADSTIQAVVESLRAHGARRVLLFGSYHASPERALDIDLAVEGIPLRRLLDAAVGLEQILGVPFDLVSREENPALFDIIKDYAQVLYEEGKAREGSAV